MRQRTRVKKYKVLIAGVVSLIMMAAATACSSGSAGSGTSDSVKGKRVVLVSCTQSNPWCGVYNKMVMATLKKAGVKVTHLADNFDPTLQVQHMQQAISMKPDAILFLAASDAALVPSIAKAKAAGIPVFATDGRADPRAVKDLTGQILADHAALGKFAAQNIVEGLKKQGVKSGNIVAVTGTLSQNLVQDRMKAFKKELSLTPEYKLVAIEDAKWDQATSVSLTQQLLSRFRSKGGIQAVYGMADQVAAGVIQGAKQAGVPVGGDQGIIVTSSNCLKVGAAFIKDGSMYGTATQTPGPEGKFVGEQMIKFLLGENLPKVVTIPEFRITASNYAKYADECQAA